METWHYIVIAVGLLFFAYVSASYAKQNGYFFWRTFILSILGFGGIFILIYNTLTR